MIAWEANMLLGGPEQADDSLQPPQDLRLDSAPFVKWDSALSVPSGLALGASRSTPARLVDLSLKTTTMLRPGLDWSFIIPGASQSLWEAVTILGAVMVMVVVMMWTRITLPPQGIPMLVTE